MYRTKTPVTARVLRVRAAAASFLVVFGDNRAELSRVVSKPCLLHHERYRSTKHAKLASPTSRHQAMLPFRRRYFARIRERCLARTRLGEFGKTRAAYVTALDFAGCAMSVWPLTVRR